VSDSANRPSIRTVVPGEARVIDLRSPEIRHLSGEVPVDSRGVPNYRELQEAAAKAVSEAQPGQLLVLTNSPYVGATVELLGEPLIARGLVPGQDVFVVARSSGAAFTVIGGVTRDCMRRALMLLPGSKGAPAPVSSAATAEMIGLAGAAIAASREALSWEIGELCRQFGVNEAEVLPAAELVLGTPALAAALDWQVRAVQPTPLLDAAMSAHRGHARDLTSWVRAELAAVGKSLAWSRILVVPGEDVRLASDISDLLRHAGAELVILRSAGRGPIDCDVVIQLGSDEPAVGPESFPIFMSATGQVLSGPGL
jgi:UDP-N-acetyl-D-glucosamine dehydrogenase